MAMELFLVFMILEKVWLEIFHSYSLLLYEYIIVLYFINPADFPV